MELQEAIERLKNLQDWYKEGNMSTTIESGELESICIVLQALEELQKENEKLKEIDLTTVYLQGACDEKTRWRQKIRKKIQQLKIEEKTRLKGKGCFDRCLILSEYQHKENVLQELLKGE